MAAAYLFHIVQNHPFVDGNKRTDAVSAVVFLALHDIEVAAPEADLEALIWAVAAGKADKEAVAEFLRTRSQAI